MWLLCSKAPPCPYGHAIATRSASCLTASSCFGPMALHEAAPPFARALVPPLLQQAPPAQHRIRNHHQQLLVEPRHARRRTQPSVHQARKRRHLLLLHPGKVERLRVGPVGCRCRQPRACQIQLKHNPFPAWSYTSWSRGRGQALSARPMASTSLAHKASESMLQSSSLIHDPRRRTCSCCRHGRERDSAVNAQQPRA
jgi:hypothetical protein